MIQGKDNPSNEIHILIVDDEEFIIKTICHQIKKNFAYECLIAKNGVEALTILADKHIDVVITDIKMPEMDGIELIKIITEKYDSDIIAMTGYVGDYLYENVIELGASDFIHKPFSQKELMARLKRVLRERHLVSNFKKAENTLKDQEAQFRVMFESSHGLLTIADENGKTLWANKAWIDTLGYTPETQGDPFEMIHPDDKDRVFDAFRKMQHDEAVFTNIEYRYRVAEGNYIYLETNARKLDVSGKIRLYVAAHNITERKQAEKIIQKTIDELERSNKELDDFAYTVSHDLKEPLRGIRNTSTFVMEDFGDKLGEDGQKRLNTLIALCDKQEKLIESVLYYSRVGRLNLSFEEVDLSQLVAEIVDSMKNYSEKEKVEFTFPQRLPTIRCDRVRIREVFSNLILNAIKYNDNPIKLIEIGAKFDTLKNNALTLYVKDNGIGIRKKHYDKIFELFKRLHAQDVYNGGAGAGLTIVKKIVERHGGKIWLESTFNEGTTFYFTLTGENHAAN